jgi:adenylate kinase
MSLLNKFSSFLFERELPDSQGKIIVLLGFPGSGKGTLAKKLVDRNGFVHISTGELIRNSDDEELKERIAKGEYATDKEMNKMLRKKLKSVDVTKGLIFDGYPRTIEQARKLDSILGMMGLGLSSAIYLNINSDTAKERLEKRSEEEDRKDDKDPETVKERFTQYREKTVPVIEFYERSRKLKNILAGVDAEEVYSRVCDALGIKKHTDGE